MRFGDIIQRLRKKNDLNIFDVTQVTNRALNILDFCTYV